MPETDENLHSRQLQTPVGSWLPRFSRNKSGRDFAVGDIHGCFWMLTCGLEVIGFDPRVDRLFSVGDLVDRGMESHRVLSWLEQPWFHAVCGNHDSMTWRAALGDPYQQVDHLQHGGQWLDLLPVDKKKLIGNRLAALPLAIEVETEKGIVGLILGREGFHYIGIDIEAASLAIARQALEKYSW